ncbi:OmpA family protein [Neptunitalea lumnitzerae]|uniref:Cell envelope biogenesis protein OmpA n=1 Tax=Neptunitalea lumnitzerae TaxID=2965509 RepID=A0ABQ5MHT1_9FLAO|nr:OmpA family protein [Neptunitalea sp. Y10]GLB48981.1 cell envelope biogenesis protein OmpA [Neptunitalea sp. Y10]
MKTLNLIALLFFASLTGINAQEDVAIAEGNNSVERFPIRERRINKLDPSGFNYEVKNLEVNSEFSDLTNHVYKNKLIYSSAKKIGLFKSEIDPNTNEAYKELFCGDIAKDREIVHSTFFSSVLNQQKTNQTHVSFTGDEKTVYFTRNVQEGDKEPLKIFRAVLDKKERQWVNLEMLDFNMEGFDYDTPYISKDGSQLFFASNMPGTLGGYDIFVVNIAEDGSCGTPRNLGNQINTSKDENYPYYLNNALYFSSEGHYGLGGFDIFESKFINNKFHFPVNMGSSINSISDDFGFMIDAQDEGFFTSNREGGKGGYDMYAFSRDKIKQFLDIIILDDNNSPLANANVIIKDEYNRVYATTTTDENGQIHLNVLPYASYAIYTEKEGFKQNIKGFEALDGDKADFVYNEIIPLEKVEPLYAEEFILDKVVLFDTNKATVSADELNDLIQELGTTDAYEITIEAFADSRSSDDYNQKLSERRGEAVKDFIIANTNVDASIINVNAYGEHHPTLSCDECDESQLSQNRRVQIRVKAKTNTTVALN